MNTLAQRSFAGGEISPSLYSRCDTTKYAAGARALRNTLVMRHGGTTNRAGTEFVAEVKDSTQTVRLLPFVFNDSQSYILESGAGYFRIFQNGTPVVVSSTPAWSSITSYNPGDCVSYSGTNYYCVGSNLNIAPTSGLGLVRWHAMSGSILEFSNFYTNPQLPDIQFVQSADVMTFCHSEQPTGELSRLGATAWKFVSPILLGAKILPPTGITANGNPTNPGGPYFYAITSIDAVTGEESAPAFIGTTVQATTGVPVTLVWTNVTGASGYIVYKSFAGVFGYILTSSDGGNNVDGGLTPDLTNGPPTPSSPFVGTGNYPSTVCYIQQRIAYGNSDNAPEKIWMSQTGLFHNFNKYLPTRSSDSLNFSLVSRQVNEIRHMIDLGNMIVLTSGGEWEIGGDSAGGISPTSINAKQVSYNGSSKLAPIIIDASALYVQARGNIVRDIGFDFQIDGYKGNDLTLFATHLFEGHTIVDWAYQKVPNSIVWAVRDDGILLGLTYVKEQQILAWHRHDFENGFVENVCAIPEGNEDILYLVIRRTINGVTKRYIERMSSRFVDDIVDANILDSSQEYDGRNTDLTKTMTLSGGTLWDQTETLTCTSSASFFSSGDVGKEIHFNKGTDVEIRYVITTYVSATVVHGTVQRTVPADLRGSATSSWSKAVNTISGLSHLEGQQVSVFADGFVVASANNSNYAPMTVTSGSLTLAKCYSVIRVGLPITSDIETLNVDTAQGETLVDKKINIGKVTMWTEKTRGLWVGASEPDPSGDPLANLVEVKPRSDEGYDDPASLVTGTLEVALQSNWKSNGRVFIRQVDPVPCSVLAIAPSGNIPLKGN